MFAFVLVLSRGQETPNEFVAIVQRRQLLLLSGCFPARHSPTEKVSTLKGKENAPRRRKFFLFTVAPFLVGCNTILAELSPLKVYQFPLVSYPIYFRTWRCIKSSSNYVLFHNVFQTRYCNQTSSKLGIASERITN